MSRALKTLTGSGAGGNFQDGDLFKLTPHIQPLKDDLDLLALAIPLCRNAYGGGDEIMGFGKGSGTGFNNAFNVVEFEIDNTNSQLSSSANLVCQVRVMVRVENAAISVTPRIFNITDNSAPTQSGAVACTATNADFSGSNQKQTISLTAVAGKKKYVVQVEKSSDSIYLAWCCRIFWDVYING